MVLETVSDNSKYIYTHCIFRESNLYNSLANAEMRLILTKLLWHFDLELSPEYVGWVNHHSYSLWDRPSMKVKLSLAPHV